jgi:hypothetical protein
MKKLWILFVVLAVFMTACGDNGPGVTNERTYIGGIEGLVIMYLPDSPPDEAVDGGNQEFTVTIQVDNKGEDTVDEGEARFTLAGFHPADFGVTVDDLTKYNEDEIVRNRINPDTGEVIESYPVFINFEGLNYEGTLPGNHEFPFQTEVCYMYETDATADLCIKEDLLDTTDERVCKVIGPQNMETSGAPVQVVDFKEATAGPDAVRFNFKVRDVGGGTSFKEGTDCEDSLTDERKIFVEVDTGMAGLDCGGLMEGDDTSGYIRLGTDTRERQVTCTQPVPDSEKQDKIKVINIHLTYDYQQYIEKTVLIKHSE